MCKENGTEKNFGPCENRVNLKFEIVAFCPNSISTPTAFTGRLTATSVVNPNYGAFVSVNPRNGDVFHNGAVGGGAGLYVMKTADNVIWSVFFNSSAASGDLNELNLLMIDAYNVSKPEIDGAKWDLFPSIGIPPAGP
jgi:hypothetical protein